MLNKFSELLGQNRWRKLLINVASLSSVQIANYLLPLLTIPYVSRIVGPEKLGLLTVALGYNHYFVLIVNFGFDLSIVRLIASNQNDKLYINKIFNQVITAKVILFVVAVLVFVLAVFVIPGFRDNIWLNILTCSYCLGNVLFPQWLYQGMEDLSKIAIMNLVAKVFFTILIFVLIKSPNDYVYQNFASSVGNIFTGLAALILAVRYYNLHYKLPNFTDLLFRYREGVIFFFISLVTTLNISLHGIIIGFTSTIHAVGIFAAASKIEFIIYSFIYLVLNQALFPVVTKAFSISTEQGLGTVRKVLPVVLFLNISIAIIVFIGSPLIISSLYGDKFKEAVLILKILSVLPVLVSLNSLMGIHTLMNLHLDRVYFFISTFASIVGVIATFFFTRSISITGTSIAWVLTELLMTISFLVYLRKIKVNLFKNISYLLRKEAYHV